MENKNNLSINTFNQKNNKKLENNKYKKQNYVNEDYDNEIESKYYNKYIETTDSNNIQE
jgi:hypothetical protein